MRPTVDLRRTLLILIASTAAGALAGAIAGWSTAGWTFDVSTLGLSSTGTAPVVHPATSTQPTVTVIPVDRRPQAPILPPSFAERRSSPVADVYRHDPKKGSDEGVLTSDRLIGHAVAVTSDGWFAFPFDGLNGASVRDLLFWHANGAATATRAVVDHTSNVIFLKLPFMNVSAPAFARSADVGVGLSAWMERGANRFEPTAVGALGAPVESLDGMISERVWRRPSVDGPAAASDMGTPIWGNNGTLVGIVSATPGESMYFIPASAWSSSLDSLLSSGRIQHAAIGVRSVDLSWVRADPSLVVPAARGAWLRDDRRTKRSAVDKASPAQIAGLRAGDVIQKLDRDILDGSVDLGELIAEYRSGSVVTFTVLRGSETLELPVTLGSAVTSEELK